MSHTRLRSAARFLARLTGLAGLVRRVRNRLVLPLTQQITELQTQQQVQTQELLAARAELQAALARLHDHRADLFMHQARLHTLQADLLKHKQEQAAWRGRQVEGQRKLAAVQAELTALRTRLAGVSEHLTGPIPAQFTAIQKVLALHSKSLRWLGEHHHSTTAGPTLAGSSGEVPRVSVVMAVWNREGLVGRAIESVLAQSFPDWELLVVDDGSTDRTREVVGRYLADRRIRYLYQEHAGVVAARNRALGESRGEIIAYLDSDNVWYPGNLAAVVEAFAADPECRSVYTGQVWCDLPSGITWVRSLPFDFEAALKMEAGVDLNAFAHRRRLFEELGGFDPALTCLVDWDLLLRYAQASPPRQLPVLGGRYEAGPWERVTTRQSLYRNSYLVRRKFDKPLPRPLRVLYALYEHPQLSESYIGTEIHCMRRWGVHVEVWSEIVPLSQYSCEEPVHRGTLAEAIEHVKPDLVHTHWLFGGPRYADVARQASLPLTIRGHGFDFTPDLVRRLDEHPAVRALFLFPHQVAACPALQKLRSIPVCFNPDRYWPGQPKDLRLVLRAGAALRTKDHQLFIRLAQKCPEHRFVLAAVRTSGSMGALEEAIEYNRSLGNPVDLRVAVQPEEMAELTRRAGIYLHTHAPDSRYGMPISICEAMATGGYVIGRRCPASVAYIGNPAQCYDDEDGAARLVNETLTWTPEQWRQKQLEAVDRAYRFHADTIVLRPILEEWLRLAAERSGETIRQAA